MSSHKVIDEDKSGEQLTLSGYNTQKELTLHLILCLCGTMQIFVKR